MSPKKQTGRERKSTDWPAGLGRRLGQALAALGLLAVPTAALAWQAGGQTVDARRGDSANRVTFQPLDQLSSQARTELNVNSSSDSQSDGNSNSSNVSQHVSITSRQDSSGQNRTDVKVNGHSLRVPASGELHQTIQTDGGSTTVDISNHKSSSGDASNSSSINLNVQSSSEAGDD